MSLDVNNLEFPKSKGARIYLVPGVTVRWGRTGREALEVGAPNTQDPNFILEIIAQYTSSGTGETINDFVLLHIPEEKDQWREALRWGERMGLRKTIPQEILAIGECHNLCESLRVDTAFVTATTDNVFRGCLCAFSNWWHLKTRTAIIRMVAELSISKNWFAFRG